MVRFAPNRFFEFQLFEFVDLIFQLLQCTAIYCTLGGKNETKGDLLIQLHALIILFICWPVRTDEVVEADNEMKSLASDVNGLEGEPFHPSACPKDISSLNVTRQQEPAEPLFKVWCLELQRR